MKPQTKSNAKRSAEAAEKRTGLPHEVFEVEGGWSHRPKMEADAGITWGDQDTGPDDEDSTSADALARRQAERAERDAEQAAAAAAEKAEAEAEAQTRANWLATYTDDVFQSLGGRYDRATVEANQEAMDCIRQRFEYGEHAEEAAGDVRELLALAGTGPSHADAQTEKAAAAGPDTAADKLTGRVKLRDAAAQVLAAWELDTDTAAGRTAMAEAVEALRRSLLTGAAAGPKSGTKGEMVIQALREPGGASSLDLMEMTGWQNHTLRGFFAGLRKKGIEVVALRRNTREDGIPAHTVYHIAEATTAEAA